MLDSYVAQLILSSRQIAYVTTDTHFQIIGYGGSTRYLSLEATLVDQPVTEVFPELIGCEEQLRALLAGTEPHFQLNYINRDDPTTATGTAYINLLIYPYRPPASSITGLLLVVEDVTTTGESRQRLTQQHNELYLLHEQLNRSNLQLAAANAELRALDELKSRFVSIAAHELRTPIASLIGYVDFILTDMEDPLSENHRSSLNVVQRSARRLLTITSDLLDLTRLEAGRLEMVLESVNIQALVRAIVLELQPEAAAKQLMVEVLSGDTTDDASPPSTAPLPPVLCDEKRTIQIFTNLIGNAVKYTPDGGTITIRFMPDPANTTVAVQISDSGIGIPADDLQQVGKAFFRAKNVHKARSSGTGLGLHITHSLLELQGGTLHIDSIEGQGTTVTVQLPIDDGLFDLMDNPFSGRTNTASFT